MRTKQEHRDYMREYLGRRYKEDSQFREKQKLAVRRSYNKYKIEISAKHYEKVRKIISYYTNNKMCCECCLCDNINFLTVDHINNDGFKHRKIIGGGSIYNWLIKNNFPKGFQILCWNCNMGKAKNHGICPHYYVNNIK